MRPGYRCAITSTARRIWNHSAIYSYGGAPRRQGAFRMRILFCNKYNYPFSGTEVYLFELMDLLRAKGHDVALFSMADPRGEPTPYDQHFAPNINFKTKSGWWQKAQGAAHAIYSTEARRR